MKKSLLIHLLHITVAILRTLGQGLANQRTMGSPKRALIVRGDAVLWTRTMEGLGTTIALKETYEIRLQHHGRRLISRMRR